MTKVATGLFFATLFASGCGGATVADAPSSSSADRPVVVCQGAADVEGGLAELRPERISRVVAVAAREGDRVEAGAVLLRLDDADVKQDKAAAQAAQTAAQARLDLASQEAKHHPGRVAQRRSALTAMSSRLAGARVTLKRQQELFTKNLVGRSDVDLAREQVHELEASVESVRGRLDESADADPLLSVRAATAEVDVATARLAQADQAVSRCVLRAPSAGAVSAVRLHVGEIAGPTMAGAIEFVPDRRWLVRAELEQEFAAEVHRGQSARVRDEMSGAGPWPAQVVRMGEVYERRRLRTDPTQFRDVPTVECVLRLEPGHPACAVGQRLRVSIYPATGDVR